MAEDKEATEKATEEEAPKAGDVEETAPSVEIKTLIGRKLACSAVFRDNGIRVAVTLIEAGPCTIVDRRTPEKNGYSAVQLGFHPKKMQRVTKPLQGQFKKAKSGAFYLLREFRVNDVAGLETGQTITGSVFKGGDRIPWLALFEVGLVEKTRIASKGILGENACLWCPSLARRAYVSGTNAANATSKLALRASMAKL